MARPPRATPASSAAQKSPTLGEAADRVALDLLPMAPRLATLGAQAALKTYAPDIPKPPPPLEFTPLVGPLWQGAEYLQDGKYIGAGLNLGLAALDGLSIGRASTGLKTALAINAKLAGRFRNGRAVQDAAREVAGVGSGWEAHHTVPLKDGKLRLIENWRHNPALIKVLPTATHKRWHGSYLGQPRLGPLARAWYGTTDLMKAGAAQVGARAADTIENFADRSDQRARERKS